MQRVGQLEAPSQALAQPRKVRRVQAADPIDFFIGAPDAQIEAQRAQPRQRPFPQEPTQSDGRAGKTHEYALQTRREVIAANEEAA